MISDKRQHKAPAALDSQQVARVCVAGVSSEIISNSNHESLLKLGKAK
jgi:hypothetical protein